MPEISCGQVIDSFLETVADQPDLPPLQIIGGNGSAALLHRDTVIDLRARTIEAPPACDLPRFRPDQTLRDLDLLVLSTDREAIARIEALARSAIGNDLGISVFGLKTVAELEAQRTHPLRSTARIFLGDRYVSTTTDGGETTAIEGFKALFPFRAPVDTAMFETFRLSIRGRRPVPTAHPAATILNYLTRSISGVRAKDHQKVCAMAEHTLTVCPELQAWIHDGPGRSSLELGRLLHTLRTPRRSPQVLQLGDKLQLIPYPADELIEHPGFMAADLGRRAKQAIIEVSRCKSRTVGRFEAIPSVVTFWQRHIEDRMTRTIHNER